MVEEKRSDQAPVHVGDTVECEVEQIMPYGAFVRLSTGQRAMIHISELSYSYVKKVEDVLELKQKIKAKVIKIDEKNRIDLSLKKMEEPPSVASSAPKETEDSFEKKLSNFLKVSDQKIADLNSKLNNAKANKKRSKKSK
ncbi:S1 RNA-binding domain-containing protein [Aminobacterium sp. MB27-C1]|jgi:S1 RNA binding domain protein|uniref:S1 RNA-binding domain-containing protein n=1 Tax=unclassified Aminobacterium TaxID=2685012 RepID=UPI001BCB7AAA|nr:MULTISPECIES: S1 RNA-binding domain-containing protein [unclassified Aminobacterium]MDD3707459.1 S1 RNA-binding domain-containing protein [Aminobacterium sp.]MDD4228801.1 S1 RNA-binding domain-containing protein [Aminobacterium sp.]MEA4876538.1 S1 RNA-binding domain-containing protein [Aminobacterium sp.]WMI71942.1 S1 RNA-binding domain-containing protein [Aminobacterium sp. MB27-C1]